MPKRIESFINNYRSKFSSWRRQFHRYPEVGWTEYVTTYRISWLLADLGFEVAIGKDALVSSERMGIPQPEILAFAKKRALSEGVPASCLRKIEGGNTGVVGILDTGREGPHIALRFDIDALPIFESTSPHHLPNKNGFASEQLGQMHACAHDGHTAIGLGIATFLREYANQLNGKFTLLFQPAEEGSRGAKAMVGKGWLDDVDYFLSGHIGIHAGRSIGEISATTTGFLATTKCDVTFKGRSAHAGKEPEKGKNALLAASASALHLHGITRNSDGQTRINVGKLYAGTGRNIVPEDARMELETRGESSDLNQYMVREAKRIIHASAELYGVEATMEVVGEGIAARSDDVFIPIIESACKRSSLVKRIIPKDTIGASEDVTYMMDQVQSKGGKATYLLFGTPLASGHHHSEFDYEEDVLSVAVDTFARTIAELQKK